MGRKKIEMKMVSDSSSRQVTFSKRRNGLFKKAHELATLCACQVAIVVFSPGGKAFSFGSPSVDAVIQRFLNEEPPQTQKQFRDIVKLNEHLADVLKKLQLEKERGKELDKALEAGWEKCKYQKPIDQLDEDELAELKAAIRQLHEKLKARVREVDASSSLLLLNEATKQSNN